MLKNTQKIFRWSGVDQNGYRIYGETMAQDADALKQTLFRQKIIVFKAKNKYLFAWDSPIVKKKIDAERVKGKRYPSW